MSQWESLPTWLQVSKLVVYLVTIDVIIVALESS